MYSMAVDIMTLVHGYKFKVVIERAGNGIKIKYCFFSLPEPDSISLNKFGLARARD